MGWCAAVFQPVGTPEWRGGTSHGESHPNQYAAAWRPAEWGVHVGWRAQAWQTPTGAKTLQIIVEIISVGVNGEKERLEEDEATSSLLTLAKLLYSFLVFNDISVTVLLWISVRDFAHSVQLLLLETQEGVFHSTKKENFSQKWTFENSPCETCTLVKLTQWRAAIFKLA